MFGHMPKSSDQGKTKVALLEAAFLELADKGWGGLRTRDVAERAGVNKALVHYHFGTMDNLRYEVAAWVMEGAINEAVASLVDSETVAEGLRAFGKSLARFGPDNPEGMVVMEFMVHVPREKPLAEILLKGIELFEASLRNRLESDIEARALPPNTDAAGLALALIAALDGLILHAYMRPDVDFTKAVEAIAALVEASTAEPNRKRS